MDEPARLGRMAEQGYEGPFYHGTSADFDAFAGDAWLTNSPKRASDYAEGWLGKGSGESARVLPLVARGRIYRFPPDRNHTDISRREIEQLRAEGYDGVEVTTHDGTLNRLMFASADGTPNIRSRFAAFDPARLAEPGLMAGVGGSLVLPALGRRER